MLFQALHGEIEMKNINLQVTLLVQNGVGMPFPSHYTPGCRRTFNWSLRNSRQSLYAYRD